MEIAGPPAGIMVEYEQLKPTIEASLLAQRVRATGSAVWTVLRGFDRHVNGEIYNHEELRKGLPGHNFRTGSDCDVIAHLYEEHGENFVDMLDGIFSFVLLDTRDNSFIVARDAIEMKGLIDDCEHFETFPPGHLYSSKEGGIFKRWYNPLWYSESIPCVPYDPLVLRKAFENAVIKRLMTDVPFGVLLSGGLDSSLVAATAVI
ncbi:hypothetical protein J5N97_026102 [Dioscorea zingiberensis]|uniref:Glutamine amidotransferase type-2 domain-containing protein n=1 Tax=Dioscorea zingiberensis TaxID=325984 RepID=A0A9D5C229_9LILI|nr:hypothetical protein J5N97_026102 [Dioscorea zingiberensis]